MALGILQADPHIIFYLLKGDYGVKVRRLRAVEAGVINLGNTSLCLAAND